MRKTLLAMLAIAMSLPALAQYHHAGGNDYPSERSRYYGLRLGLALATVNSDAAELDGGRVQAGLNIGAVAGFQLSAAAPVYLETGLYYTEKGGKGDRTGTKITFNLNYLEVPIVAKYIYNFTDEFSIQPFLGGYLALGVSGKTKDWANRTRYASFSGERFQRFDGGLRIGCGAEYQMIYLEMAYDIGLSNVCHDDFDGSHTRSFNINLGVNF